MVNASDFINNETIQKGLDTISITSKTLTIKLTEWAATKGFPISPRFSSLVILLIGLVMIWIAGKITKPFLKWAIIILSVIILAGMLVPGW